MSEIIDVNVILINKSVVDGFCGIKVAVERAGERYAENKAYNALKEYDKCVKFKYARRAFSDFNAEKFSDREGEDFFCIFSEDLFSCLSRRLLWSVGFLGNIAEHFAQRNGAVGMSFAVIQIRALVLENSCAQ